ncbi:MAG: hypothetical protein MK198_06735 [Gracilimonas sp.]|uniref:hypothetical protein n=1 Tax=Gracilimonas sp. TaxID=1974203 RepID=UPI003752E71D|nr:hypothetical protein [Gracilimonas sp.]
MIGRGKIQEFKKYISDFRWENYQRDYRKNKELKNLYWHIVFLDYLDSKKNGTDDSFHQDFSRRLHKTFKGIFFKPHEVTAKFESKLEGFSKLYIRENQKLWKSWYDELQTDFRIKYWSINEIISSFTEHRNKQQSKSDNITLNLIKFDTQQKIIDQVVSDILSEHIRFTRYRYQKRSEALTDFPFTIPMGIVDQIHNHAIKYFTSRFTFGFLKSFESRLPSDGPFTLTKSESIENAFKALLQRYPDFTRLDRNTLVEMFELYCQNLEGQKFNKASVRSFLRREGYS